MVGEMRRGGPSRPAPRSWSSVAFDAELRRSVLDDGEGFLVGLHETGDLVDRLQGRLALFGGRVVKQRLLDLLLHLVREVTRDGPAVVRDLRAVGEDDDIAG